MKDKYKTLISKFKDFYSNPYGMLITVSWLLLIVCLIIKLFGGNWFELGSENSKFIQFCLYVDNHMWLKMILACLIYLLSGYFIISIALKQKMNLKLICIFYPIMIIKSILNWYISIIPFILDVVILFVLPLIITKNWKRPLFCVLGVLALQIISILVRNVSFGFGQFNYGNTFIVQFLYQIDYYIMIILWYLYTFKRKEIK